MKMPSTVEIDCPRPTCSDKIACTLKVDPGTVKPGPHGIELRVSVPDAGPRIAEHYRAAHSDLVHA